MAQLIQMRQRIKTIETIKKVTHAMRLIAMSSHARLRQKQETLRAYCSTIDTLFSDVRSYAPLWKNTLLQPAATTSHHLIILVGSQKGLCGNFNSVLFDFFKKNNNLRDPHPIVTVGKKAHDFVTNKCGIQTNLTFNELTIRNYLSLGRQIIDFLKRASHSYSSVTLYSNFSKGFFAQKPVRTELIPLKEPSNTNNDYRYKSYIFDQPVEEILQELSEHYLTAHLQYLLFESLLAEQAARFISMDNSTRNANSLLETTKIKYNKIRQAKITSELIELTGSLTTL